MGASSRLVVERRGGAGQGGANDRLVRSVVPAPGANMTRRPVFTGYAIAIQWMQLGVEGKSA